MSDNLDVRIVKLEPARVASVLGFGAEPEMLAWNKLLAWAESRGLPPEKTRLFGFNNPNPAPGSPNYGYEVWMIVGPDIPSDDTVIVKDMPGGLYAVTRCQGVSTIYDTWQKLVAWVEQSRYRCVNAQCLEEHKRIRVPPEELVFDLYLPVAE